VDVLFEQATAAYDAKRFPEAEAKLAEAWGIRKTFDVAGNLGVVELKLGKPAQAAGHLTWALQHFAPSQSERVRQGYQKALDTARAQCAALRVRVSLAGAEVAVDGRMVGVSPIEDEVFVDAGDLVIEARREGSATVRQAVTVGKGEAREVALVMAPVAVVPATAKRPLWPVVVGSVLAVGGLAAGAGLTVAANGKSTDIDGLQTMLRQGGSRYPCASAAPAVGCTTLRDTAAARDRLSNAAVASFVTGGVLAVTTAGLGIWLAKAPADEKADPRQLRIAPVVGLGEGRIAVSGAW